ncbi:major facilitator superfamily domain-containing protein [Limtongia smithiae]|uniref:major facilitator superfamily domain-containing protein n=1 Tax=Limtongia smithiae TaxID=1125753 RepID=UPI0034D000D5
MSSGTSELEIEEVSEQDALLSADIENQTVIDLQAEEDAADEREEEALKTGALLTIFFSMQVGVFLAAVDSTIVATIISNIASEFHEFRSVSWIITGYLIAQAAFLPLYGKLSDIFGRKPILIVCNLFFGVGSVLCGVAPNLWCLVAARVIAGCGGGGLFTMSAIVLSDIVPMRQRGMFQGVGNIIYGSGAAIGGIIGGALSDAFGWRWTFAIQGPIVLVSLVAIYLNLKEEKVKFNRALFMRIDFIGSATLITGLVLFLFGVSAGGIYFAWNSSVIIGSLVVSVIILSVFIYLELYVADEPVINLRLLKNRTVAGSAFTGWFINMGYYTNIFYISVYMLTVQGVSAAQSGGTLIPQFVGTASGSFVAGYYTTKTGRTRPASNLAAILLFTGMFSLCWINASTPRWVVSFLLFVPGFGGGIFFTTTLIGMISAVDYEVQAVCTSVVYGFRTIGATVGVATAAAIFSNTLASRLEMRITGPGAEEIIRLVQDSVDEIALVPPEWRSAITQCFLDAVHAVLYTSTMFSFFAGLSSLLMKEHVLHRAVQRKPKKTAAATTPPAK